MTKNEFQKVIGEMDRIHDLEQIFKDFYKTLWALSVGEKMFNKKFSRVSSYKQCLKYHDALRNRYEKLTSKCLIDNLEIQSHLNTQEQLWQDEVFGDLVEDMIVEL